MNGFLGKVTAAIIMKVLKIDKINRIHNKYHRYSGPDFAEKVLDEVGVKYDLKLGQLDNIPQEGAFITISNHNFGSIDGLLLSAIIGRQRPDFKILTNFILSLIPAMKESYIAVDPFKSGTARSVQGLKNAISHLNSGGCLGLFPAGEVATTQSVLPKRVDIKDRVKDIPWPVNMIKFIKRAGIPVVPIYFDGTNSKAFHWLGKIHPRLRTIKLVSEMLNKRGKTVPMRIGKPILPSELEEYSSIEELGGYLRSRVYALQQEFVRQYKSSNRGVDEDEIEQIAIPRDRKGITRELEKLKDNILFTSGPYQCYLADYEKIPNSIMEIGRLREDAFRAVGEGTNKARDLDDWDKYYKHLILWDSSQKKIAGAYRIGIGADIAKEHNGTEGFYTSSLYKYQIGAEDLLPQCAELGRSFVNREYQKESIALMLLFKGLMYSMMRFPDVKYLMGPVSISNDYPRFYKSLMVWYLSNVKPCTYPRKIASPTTPFVPDFINVKPEDLLRRKIDTVERFDRFLLSISDGTYRMPTLVKKYFKCGAQLICFNVDPDFNYSLDGLILLQLDKIPKSELVPLLKNTTYREKEALLGRYGYMIND